MHTLRTNSQTNDGKWWSVYIFYNGDLEDVLISVVSPIIKVVHPLYIEKFFFIRYYENGAHIRLRLKCTQNTFEKHVKPLLESIANDFAYQVSLNNKMAYLQYVPYLTENERYGGINGVILAEEIFQISSKITLQIIGIKNWNCQKALGVAIQLQLISIFFFFEDIKKIESFLLFGQIGRMQLALGKFADNDFVNDFIKRQDEVYTRQKDNINLTLNDIWIILNNDVLFDDRIMEMWRYEIRNFALKLRINLADMFSFNTISTNSPVAINEDNEVKKWMLIDSYMHMTNNRLGIFYKEESYIYFILREFFAECIIEKVTDTKIII